jgi:L-ascorbate metabolism protein UlaG (beta-lactamase superfamily)
MTLQIQFFGHATMRLELDGVRLMTDPILRAGVAGLVHRAPVTDTVTAVADLDAVLISHLHHDHLDFGSLKLMASDVPVLVPPGAGAYIAKHGFPHTRELAAGESWTATRGGTSATTDGHVGEVRVSATRADHRGYRVPFGPNAGCVGFLIRGSQSIYFAGDTALFAPMADLGPVDVALLPVAGWGPRLGPGHMDPEQAVAALKLLRPRVAIPIHWGALVPRGLHLRQWSYLTQPPLDFVARARVEAPEVIVHVLSPGAALEIAPAATP